MTHVPFTSRLASLMGISSHPPSPKYDGTDEYYIPYTGTYEPAPATSTAGAAAAGSSSTHTQARTHVHTLSGSTKNTHTNQSLTTSGHPYNPDRFVYAPTITTSTLAGTGRGSEEVERGRRPSAPPRISTSSSFAAMTPSEYHGSAFPKIPSTVNPHPTARRGGPSYLALDSGFIGQSPVAAVPSAGGGGGGGGVGGGRSEGGKSDKAAYRSSFASFITFGNSRKSVASGSGLSSGHGQVLGAEGGGGSRIMPHSATSTFFPHGASKLRGELRPSAADFFMEGDEEDNGGQPAWMSLPPIPPYMRQRSQSYVDETDQMWRRKSEEERRLRALEEEERMRKEYARAQAQRNSVKVTMPTSFFDTSPAEEHGVGASVFGGKTKQHAQSHPYHRHYQPTIVEPSQSSSHAVDLNSPISPSFEFLHPYATASTLPANTSPTKSAKSRPSNVSVRPLALSRKPMPDFQHREPQQQQQQHRQQPGQRERSATATSSSFPFVNPFSFSSPPTSRPATPKGRLKSLVSLEGLRTLKGSISTPNLRAASAKIQPIAPAAPEATQSSHTGHGARIALTVGTSRAIPPNAIFQGQTLCDTFFLPRPRFHAHQISPPDTPYTPAPTTRSRQRSETVPSEVIEAREWNRRATASTVAVTRSDPDAERRLADTRQIKALGKKKASAPDLRRRPNLPALKDMRRLTEAQQVLLRGQEQDREREEWQRAAKGSFQNERSRSLSRTRTKSFAKASNSAANSGDERERPSRKNTIVSHPAQIVIVPHSTGPGTAPPTATSSSGPATSGDEARSSHKELPRPAVKRSMEYLATKAFSQGYPSIAPAPGSTSSHSHTRHQSGDLVRDRQHRERGKNQSISHRRSESWGRTALKIAKNSCADPEAVSPAIERVLQQDPSLPLVQISKPPHEDVILDIGPSKVEERPNSNHSSRRPSAIGIAIGTPPLDTLLNDSAVHIDHPYNSPLGSPVYVGPHPATPMTSLPQSSSMNDVVSRHRLPPRPHNVLSSPRSPGSGLSGLDAYIPTMTTGSQSVLSRESWLVYMNAMEDSEESPQPVDKGKGRAVDMAPIIYEERPSRDVPEDVDITMDTPELQLDLGLDGSPSKSMRSRIISAQDLETQLTKAFRRESATSMDSSENIHAALTFEAGATLSRLLSSRSVTSTPRSGLKRTLSNPETPKVKKAVMLADLDDPHSTLTQPMSPRPPLPNFEPKTHQRSSSGGASRRISGYSDGAASASGHDSLWRKSIASSDLAAHSPPSHESSPKASPRTLLNLDDLDGYSDLFYTGGHGSISGRPKSGSSGKTNVSSGLVERAFRPEMVIFGSKGSGSSGAVDRSHSSSESTRAAAGRTWSVGGLSPPSRGFTKPASNDTGERLGDLGKLSEEEVERTWDPEEEEEEEEEEPYRIGNTRPPIAVRPMLPTLRHSTKLSVIEGSVDEHATASESTADPEELESVPATSPTHATYYDANASRPVYPPLSLDRLHIPSDPSRRTSSERAVAPEGYARTSMMTNTSGQSRMSHLSDFPSPPAQSTTFALTPSDVLQTYFPPRASSPVQPASPASLISAEPPSPAIEPDENEDRSVSDHHQAFSSLTMTSTPIREYRSNRATFGPDADIARQWAERERTYTPSTEEH